MFLMRGGKAHRHQLVQSPPLRRCCQPRTTTDRPRPVGFLPPPTSTPPERLPPTPVAYVPNMQSSCLLWDSFWGGTLNGQKSPPPPPPPPLSATLLSATLLSVSTSSNAAADRGSTAEDGIRTTGPWGGAQHGRRDPLPPLQPRDPCLSLSVGSPARRLPLGAIACIHPHHCRHRLSSRVNPRPPPPPPTSVRGVKCLTC